MDKAKNIRILIIEDEQLAFEKIQAMLFKIDARIEICGHVKSISDANRLIKTIRNIDLAFFDIQLSDGLSFSILEENTINFPVIFTTAYSEHAIRAFKHNSIDYLLKPIQLNDLANAIDKFQQHWNNSQLKIGQLLQDLKQLPSKEYKARFTVKVGEHIRMINTEDIACFYSYAKATFIGTTNERNYPIDFSLDTLVEMLNPTKYYRVNRRFIINIEHIDDIISYSNSRLEIKLITQTEDRIIVSRERVRDFKIWIEG